MFSRVDSALYTLWQDQLSLSSMGFTDTPRGGGGGVISIDRDERRFFLGKKILVSNFFFLFLVLYHLMLSENFYGSKTRHGIFGG